MLIGNFLLEVPHQGIFYQNPQHTFSWRNKNTLSVYPCNLELCCIFDDVYKHVFGSVFVFELGEGKMIIALDKKLLSYRKYWYFSYFSTKTYVVGTHKKCLQGTSYEYPQHIFLWRNKKNIYPYTLGSEAMVFNWWYKQACFFCGFFIFESCKRK